MAVDLELIPYKGKPWPKKATLVRQKQEYHIRNWNDLFEIISTMPKKEVPDNVALVRSGYPEGESITTSSPLVGPSERLQYLPASKIVAAMKKAIKKWVPIEPTSEWAEQVAESYKKIRKILRVMKRLRPGTPVILYWW